MLSLAIKVIVYNSYKKNCLYKRESLEKSYFLYFAIG